MSVIKKKNINRRNQIQKILMDKGKLPLSQIAKFANISLPVATSLVKELVKGKIISEVEGTTGSGAGRPPVLYKLNGNAGYFLGLDLGRIYTNYVILNLEQEIVFEKTNNVLLLNNDPLILTKLEDEVNKVLDEAKIKWNKVLGIGLSIPGIVKGMKGISETYLNFFDKPLADVISEKFKKPVRIEHDVKAMTYGELWFGNATGSKNVLCVNFGWGLGLGLVLNGKLYYGENQYAGEFGHIPLVPNGRLCYCGKQGCLETVSSGRAIIEIAKEKINKGAKTLLSERFKDTDDIDPVAVLDAAGDGDQFSIEILEEAGRYLGVGIAILINIFNPSKIIIGGDISSVATYIIDYVKSSAMKHSLPQLNSDVIFEVSPLGKKVSALGVARLIANEVI